MELIPILSFIILVATVSTFILAVGAYILYKVRERKGRVGKAAEPAAIPAELISPAQLASEKAAATQTGMRRTLFEDQPSRYTGYEQERQPLYYGTQESREFRPTFAPTPPPAPPTYAETSQYLKTGAPQQAPRPTMESTRGKFMRYTAEGYVAPNTEKKEEKKKEETLRWR